MQIVPTRSNAAQARQQARLKILPGYGHQDPISWRVKNHLDVFPILTEFLGRYTRA